MVKLKMFAPIICCLHNGLVHVFFEFRAFVATNSGFQTDFPIEGMRTIQDGGSKLLRTFNEFLGNEAFLRSVLLIFNRFFLLS